MKLTAKQAGERSHDVRITIETGISGEVRLWFVLKAGVARKWAAELLAACDKAEGKPADFATTFP